MKKIHRVLALLMAALMALGLMTTAFAATDSAPTIDPSKKASLSIYKYDITKASNDGAWDVESYVSTGLHDDAVIDKLSKYAIQGVEFTYLRIADITMNNEAVEGQRQVGVLYGFDGSERSNAVLSAIGLTAADAHKTAGGINYFTSDTIEIMLSALYQKWGISEETDFRRLMPEDYPILSDLYALINDELVNYRNGSLYTRELLQEALLGLHSLCVGADAPFFNGHTNISDDRLLVFGVGGVLTAARSLRNALLFNVLAYMSDRLLTAGNTVAALDELYLWLSNPIAIEYIRNCLKRVRKRDSALMMASQNLEDFDQEGVREMTKPLFAIPPHQFLFNPGSIGKRFYMDMLQLDEAEFDLIQHARRGECLFKCGMERYHLEVKAPPYKAALFGTKGGK